jgi:hypothetical protein
MRHWLMGSVLTVLLAAPALAQEPAAKPDPLVTLQEVGHSLRGMDLLYAELREALRQRDSIYQAFTAAVLAIPAPTADTPREALEAAVRTARAEAVRAQGEAAPYGSRVEGYHARFANLSGIARERYQAVLDVIGER